MRVGLERVWYEKHDSQERPVQDDEFEHGSARAAVDDRFETEIVVLDDSGGFKVVTGKPRIGKLEDVPYNLKGQTVVFEGRTYRRLNTQELDDFRLGKILGKGISKADQRLFDKRNELQEKTKGVIRKTKKNQSQQAIEKGRLKGEERKRMRWLSKRRKSKHVASRPSARGLVASSAKPSARRSDEQIGARDPDPIPPWKETEDATAKSKSAKKKPWRPTGVKREDIGLRSLEVGLNEFYTPGKHEVFAGQKLEKHTVVFDTGAGVTAFTRHFGSMLATSEPAGRNYTSAGKGCKGIADECGRLVECVTEEGVRVPGNGRVADIRQVLLSGAGVARSQDVWLSKDEGIIIPRDGIIAQKMRGYLEHLIKKHPTATTIPMYVAIGVYKLDLWTKADESVDDQTSGNWRLHFA